MLHPESLFAGICKHQLTSIARKTFSHGREHFQCCLLLPTKQTLQAQFKGSVSLMKNEIMKLAVVQET
jgi:hypothetical protein